MHSSPETSAHPVEEKPGGSSSLPNSQPDHFAILVLVAFSLLVYLVTTGYDFVADDKVLLEHNPYVQGFHYLREIFTRNFWSFLGARGESTYYRPLVMFALLLEREVFGPRPAGFHLVNVLLNAVVVALVFVLGKRLWPRGRGVLWAGLLFAALPVHSEDVAPVSGISDLLCALFFVLALVIYTQPGDSRPGRLSHLAPWMAATTFLFAVLCKEVALVLPVLVVFYEHCVRPHVGASGAPPPVGARRAPLLFRRASRYAPMFLALAIYFVFRTSVVRGFGAVLTANRLGWKDSLLFGLSELGNYVYKLVWPQHLTYAWKFHPPQTWWEPSVLFGGFVAGLAIVAFTRSWRRERALALAVLWFFLTLAPALNLAGVGVTAYGERYLYIPSVAFCWLVGEAGAYLTRVKGEVSRRPVSQRGIALAFLAVLVVLAALRTAFRLPAWKSNLTLAQATLAEDPNSATYHLYLGNIYRERGKRELARIEYVQAIALDPSVGEAYLNMAGVLFDDGAAEAARDFLERAVEANPRLAEGFFELGREELRQHHPDQARELLGRAVALNPNYFDALYLLGGTALEAGRLQEAQDLFRRALEANPLSVEAHLNLGAVLARQGDDRGAESEFRRAMELAPGSDAPCLSLAALFEGAGKQAAALDMYRLAVRAQPSSANALFRLGVLALKIGKVEEAREALQNVVRMQPTSALGHLQLGLAYRAAGKLREARQELEEALRLDPSNNAATLALQQLGRAAPQAANH